MPSFNNSRRSSRHSTTASKATASVDSESTIAMLAKMFAQGKMTQQQFIQALAVLHIGVGTVTPPKLWQGGKRRRGTKKRRGH
jgi:hypothetical protein